MKLVTNHYDRIGVSPTASVDEIRDAEAAVRRFYQGRLAQDPEARAALQALDEARRVLLDDALRAAYDRDPAALAYAYPDVAATLPIGRHDRLAQLADWLGAFWASSDLDGWATPDPLLDDIGTSPPGQRGQRG